MGSNGNVIKFKQDIARTEIPATVGPHQMTGSVALPNKLVMDLLIDT